MIYLVATIEVRRQAEAGFRQYEARAAAIMAKYGGLIERAIKVDGPAEAESFVEIHVVRFPDHASLESYRLDPELAALAAMRERAVMATTVVRGRAAPSVDFAGGLRYSSEV